ncbi:MAG TPA: protein translocase subunit SecF [Longimicrobiales bacterium]|nr:protein translocase subunit SecF [Longimicrobiales bacterium]
MRFFANARFHFIENRKKAYTFSAAVIGIGLVAIAVNLVTLGSWVPYGVDFSGGALVQVRFTGASVDAGDLRSALGGAQAPPLTRFGEENEFVIRAPLEEGVSLEAIAAGIESEINTAFGAGSFEIVRTELVGAKVGGELQRKAILALLFSFVITLAYLAIRFELRFGMAAVIATIHDILITMGFMALMRLEFDLPSVAAILTVVGYSLNDTIIVFDRIRENLHKKGARKRDPVELINESINETLPRTILTSGTTLAVLVALILFGGPVIRDFTMVLILGIAFGTYSSIFVASPALLEIQKRWGLGELREKKPKPEPAPV